MLKLFYKSHPKIQGQFIFSFWLELTAVSYNPCWKGFSLKPTYSFCLNTKKVKTTPASLEKLACKRMRSSKLTPDFQSSKLKQKRFITASHTCFSAHRTRSVAIEMFGYIVDYKQSILASTYFCLWFKTIYSMSYVEILKALPFKEKQ